MNMERQLEEIIKVEMALLWSAGVLKSAHVHHHSQELKTINA